MAQLGERTLGKGEVPSSILGISTMFFDRRLCGFFVFVLLISRETKFCG